MAWCNRLKLARAVERRMEKNISEDDAIQELQTILDGIPKQGNSKNPNFKKLYQWLNENEEAEQHQTRVEKKAAQKRKREEAQANGGGAPPQTRQREGAEAANEGEGAAVAAPSPMEEDTMDT